MFDKVKAHVKRNEKVYLVGSFVVVSGVTFVLTRSLYVGVPSIPDGQDLVIVRAFSFLSKQKVVTFVSQNRQGPPSWVVRCIETGEVFNSQRAAAFAKGINPSDLSQHLNGLHDNVKNLHFERICLAG